MRKGNYFSVDHARFYSLLPHPSSVFVAASGPRGAALAGRIGDGPTLRYRASSAARDDASGMAFWRRSNAVLAAAGSQ
jgi:alkanesulfonate monooxygenase SsuD/methylene tetrahydromethanopterin reductase-like flavin-dependent oxidoreductase (luciferase family)